MTALHTQITVGELAVRFLELCGTQAAFGVISIHNMPILDAFNTRQKIRFVSARGEAGACNMADAYARVTGRLGVCVTSTGTGAGNAAGALIEALTAGTPMLHLTGQIESDYLDRDLGYIHEATQQLAMLQSVGKAAFRVRNTATALATFREAHRLAFTAPCGPVSIEIPIDIQASLMDLPADLAPLTLSALQPDAAQINALAARLITAKRPLLWLGGGARGARAAAERFIKIGWGVVTSVQGRGIIAEDNPASLGSYNLQKPAEDLYQSCDAMLAVGTRLRSNETLRYKLKLPRALYRIDANALAHNRGYTSDYFVQGDAAATLNALADVLEGQMQIDKALHADVAAARAKAAQAVDTTLGAYLTLKNAVEKQAGQDIWWVRDIILSNSMWGTAHRCSTTRVQACTPSAAALARAWRWRLAPQLQMQNTALNAKPWRWRFHAERRRAGLRRARARQLCAAADERLPVRRHQEHPGRYLRQPPLLCGAAHARLCGVLRQPAGDSYQAD